VSAGAAAAPDAPRPAPTPRAGPVTLTVVACGVTVRLELSDARALERVEPCLPPGWRRDDGARADRVYALELDIDGDVPGGPGRSSVRADGAAIARDRALGDALEAFDSDVKLFVAEMSPGFVFVHAGVVGWRGRAILLPGRSYVGKTTLVMELVRAGAAYCSDEYAVLDAQGRVHAYPAAPSIRPGAGRRGVKRPLGRDVASAGAQPLPAGAVVVTSFRPGSVFRPRELTRGQGVLALLSNTVSARRAPGAALVALERAVADAVILSGERGDAGAAAEAILQALDGAAAA